MEHSIINLIIKNEDRLHELVQKITKSAEYIKISERMDRAYDNFIKTLSKDQIELLNRLEEHEADEQVMVNESYFRTGVKLGVRLLAECMFD